MALIAFFIAFSAAGPPGPGALAGSVGGRLASRPALLEDGSLDAVGALVQLVDLIENDLDPFFEPGPRRRGFATRG